MNIPEHLAHLPLDRVGRPVPYINAWGIRDDPERITIRYDRNIKQIGVHYADDPDGEPDFAQQNMQRQREIMIRGLCQVCARPVDWPDRSLVLSPVTVQAIDGPDGQRVAAVHEPWLCPICADFALNYCPALIRRQRDDQLSRLAVPSPDMCRLVVSSGWIDGPFEYATKTNPVAMWVKILLPESVLQIVEPEKRKPTPREIRSALSVAQS